MRKEGILKHCLLFSIVHSVGKKLNMQIVKNIGFKSYHCVGFVNALSLKLSFCDGVVHFFSMTVSKRRINCRRAEI